MDEKRKAIFNQLEGRGYLPELRKLVMQSAAPFWWFGIDEFGRHRVFHNGTLTVFRSGVRQIGVTADHVYAQFLNDKALLKGFGCQFGGITADPEKWLIDRNQRADLATFEIPDVVLGLAKLYPHQPLHWPTEQVGIGDVVMCGGYPGSLREEREGEIESPFETLSLAVTSSFTLHFGLQLDIANVHWPFHEGEQINARLGGMSGGGVYRVVADPIERVELVGFIYEYSEQFDLMFARHARFVAQDGTIHFEE